MSHTHTLAEFRSKFRIDELKIYDTGIWTWSLRPDQPTLGSSVISLNRYALHFSDVTTEEMADLSNLIKIVEKTLKKTFNQEIMNYLMLMMVDHHVHYHVIPRYDGTREFEGLEWVDNGWPALPVMPDSQHKNQQGVLEKICGFLKTSVSE